MTIAGAIYGVVLNDRLERERLSEAFGAEPYRKPPEAPVVYMKPRLCATYEGASVPLPEDVEVLSVAATVALSFGRDAAKVAAADAWSCVGAACLALDVSVPEASYYRPAIAQRCRDGFLPLGRWGEPQIPDEIVTHIDGVEAHRWALSRLVRPAAALIADLSAFMTLKAGDVLLLGLPGDAPRAAAGQDIRVEAHAMGPIHTRVERRAA